MLGKFALFKLAHFCPGGDPPDPLSAPENLPDSPVAPMAAEKIPEDRSPLPGEPENPARIAKHGLFDQHNIFVLTLRNGV